MSRYVLFAGPPAGILIILCVIGLFLGVWLLSLFYYAHFWIKALLSGCPVSFPRLIQIRIRGLSPSIVVSAYLQAHHADLELTLDQLEKHGLTGGHPKKVVEAMIRIRQHGIDVPFEIAARTDLAGYDLARVSPEQFREALAGQEDVRDSEI